MYKARNSLRPGNIHTMFFTREGGYNLRRKFNLKKLCVCTTMKCLCISSCGVELWNDLDVELKQSTDITQFKKKCKKNIFQRFKNEEGP